jgi:hypothetical protein
MSFNIRALLMGSLRNVVLRMDLLVMHDCYGARVCFQSCVMAMLMDTFGQLLANMKLSKPASVSQGMASTPHKRKLGVDDIVVGHGVRPRMEDMSIGEHEGEKGEGSSKMVL